MLVQFAEFRIYQFWKGIAPYSAILDEGIRRQTNAIGMSEEQGLSVQRMQKLLTPEQTEIQDLSEQFKKRFLTAFPEGQQAQAPLPEDGQGSAPSAPTLTPEDRAKILELTVR